MHEMARGAGEIGGVIVGIVLVLGFYFGLAALFTALLEKAGVDMPASAIGGAGVSVLALGLVAMLVGWVAG